MNAKFMAFENVPSTSNASMDQDEAVKNTVEMKSNQYLDYKYQSNRVHDGAATSTELSNIVYGAVGVETEEGDVNLKEKTKKDVRLRKFIYKNGKQFKSI